MNQSRLSGFILVFAIVLFWPGFSGAAPVLNPNPMQITVDPLNLAVGNIQLGGPSSSYSYRLAIRALPPGSTVLDKPAGWHDRTMTKPGGVRAVFFVQPRRVNRSIMVAPGEQLEGFMMSFNGPGLYPYRIINFDFSTGERDRGEQRTAGILQVVPAPPAVLLLGSGLIIFGGFLGAKRRKR